MKRTFELPDRTEQFTKKEQEIIDEKKSIGDQGTEEIKKNISKEEVHLLPVRGNNEKFNLDRFFNTLINNKKIGKKVTFILINHFVPTDFPLSICCERVGRITLIIPKGSYQDIKSRQER